MRRPLALRADVIEHVIDPDELISFLLQLSQRFVVISTPAREMVKVPLRFFYGPPSNPGHVREWKFDEFASYIKKHMRIIEHQVSNIDQAMQIAHQHHQAGQLTQAREIYQQVLVTDPNHIECLNLLGTLSGQLGEQ